MGIMPSVTPDEILAEMEPFFIGFMIAMLVIYLIMIVFIVISYVLQGIGMYTIAKRRGIHNPWMAWVPFVNAWLLGSISDQFQYVAYGKITNRRKYLMGLQIALAVTASAWACFQMLVNFGSNSVGIFGLFLIAWLAYMGVMVWFMIIHFKSMYDLYKSCNPSRAVLFLLLSIFVAYPQPFFVFACRNQDLGMPPRRQPQPVQEIPAVVETAETAEPAEAAQEEIPVAEEACTADESDFAEE